MARSRKKSPAGGIAIAESDKEDKVIAHRQQRAQVRDALAVGNEPVTRKKAGSPWTFSKDGKRWFGWDVVERYPKLVRK